MQHLASPIAQPTAHSLGTVGAWPGGPLAPLDPTLAPVPAAPATATRVRWGRILLVTAGIALAAAGTWSALREGTSTDASKSAAPVGISDSDATDSDTRLPSDDLAVTAPPKASKTPSAATTRSQNRGTQPKPRTARRTVAGGGAGVASMRAADAAAASTVADRAATRATGAGATAGELPYTGAESWIAAILGLVLLGLGICVQINAVRIGMTAMLYRRGILLRPVDCARLAQHRGLPQARVWISNALHRLLEAPAGAGEFVAAR